ncbi:MAG: discoidin domain-containing protein [Terriglobales bacterium]
MTAQAPSSANAGVNVVRHPREEHLTRGKPFQGDVRTLPQVPPTKFERPEFEEPEVTPVPYPGTAAVAQGGMATSAAAPNFNAPAPSPSSSFEGLDFANWGAGHPPDTNGDVGPQHYLQTINTSVGVYGKNGVRLAAFTFNTLMSQGSFGNLCDTNNFGDPVVLYDTFEDRWIITDFAFKLDGSGNIIAPAYQCLAVSKSGDPVAGGWNFYSISSTSGFGDYPKFGIWPDGLYMSANMFGFGAGGSFQNVRVWAFNKAQMYAGEPAVQVLSFDAPSAEFTLLPSNARLQTGTPPAGSPNYFAVVWQFLNAVSVYKFHVNWTSTSTSTFSGPFTSLTPTWWAQYLNSSATTVPSPANRLDSLYPRLMVQNQYTNLGGAESLWTSHTVGAGNPTSNVTSAQAAVRYYQVKVTGGNVEASATQSFTYSPDSTVFRFMPSVAVDRAGDMAIGYSASDAALNPAIRYAARLAGDPLNAITQTEQSLLEGTGSQSGSCGSTCVRWGDYSAMTLDVDGCTFWYTNLYYQTTGLSFNTRIGTFSLPGCTAVTTGSLQGTVTAAASGNPISGATVELGSRTATTDVNGNYDFTSLASGVYPSVASSSPGYNSMTAANIVVSDGGIATQNFSLTSALTSGCFTDTTQADFQAGVPTNCDLTNSPGDVILVNSANLDQQNTTLGNSGVGITTTTWGGQTFTPAVTGRLTRADINLFCSGCTGTTPDLTLSVRATSGGLPTGADLAAATITGFSNASAVLYTANFSSPATLTSGTQYALVIRPTANPSAGTYALTRSGTSTAGADVYAGGARVSGASSGTVWSIPPTGGVTTDAGFKTYMQTGFASSGTFVSSTKDANPAPGANVNWTTLSWTADTPANTAIQFQVASSNIADGPFNFVGPDGTTGTFFTNGGSLAQFAGQRYLKYQASLTTTSGAVTPTLHDVSVCFSDFGPTTLVVAEASGPFGGTADLFAILTSGGIFVSDKSMSFKLNGHTVGSALSDGSGNATVAAVSLAGITAGTYPGAVTAAFAGDSGFGASSGSGTLTVQKLAQTITFGALASKTFGNPDFGVSATASSGLTVTFAASGNCTVTGSTVHITGAGSCTITASQAGDSNYNPAADVPQSFSIQTPALPASGWRVLYVDSQATDCGNYGATNTFDGNNATMWLTEYCHGSPATPHEIQIDLGASYNIAGFQYLPRQDGTLGNGNVANYEFYVSTDGVNWGTAVSTGTLMTSGSDKTQKQVTFTGVVGRYVRFRAMSEVHGGPWTAVAELNVLGTQVATSGPQVGSLTLNPASIAGGGTTSTATVTLTSAPLTNATVTLASSNTAATVPATVTVNAGTTSANFTVTSASSVSTSALSVITATYNSSTGAALLAVTPGSTSIVSSIPQAGWLVQYVDSQATDCGNYGATNAIDGNPATMWITEWCHGSPTTPHEIQIDLGANYTITGFQYLPRQDGGSNGNVANYEFYLSIDGVNWGTAVSTGTLMTSASDKTQKQVNFAGVVGRYVRFRAMSEVHGGPWTAVAELNVLGTPAVPVALPTSGWHLLYVDSEATDCGNYAATNAFDGNPATMWLTEWCHSSPPPPHEIQIDLGASYSIAGFQYLPRQDGGSNGNVANYEFYVSSNEVNWGTAVSTGTLMTSASDKTQKQVTFPGVVGRYVRFRAMSEVHGGPWTAVAELNVLGIPVATSPPEIASVTITPASITAGGTASTVTVALTNTPTSNATVTLASSNTNAATVPATVVVNAGTTTASFEATSVAFVSTNTVSQISASLNGSSGSAVLTVTPASLARIQQSGWHVVFVDSQATDCGNYGATNAFDGNPATMWLTEWCHGSPAPPHEIQIDLGASYTISGFQYLPRQDGSNGNVANYEFYVSADGANWGAAVASGTLIATPSDLTQKQVTFTGVVGRYVRFRAMSEVHGGPWTALAELNVLGTPVWSGILAPSRAINWSTAGVTGGIPNRTTVCATIDPYDGPADAINTAIANCPSGQVVLLSAGTFNLTSGIVFDNKSNVTLRGAGPDQTFLLFSAGGSCTGVGGADVCLITADTGDGGDQDYSNAATWTGGYSVGTTSITLGSATTGSIAALQVGSQIFLDQLDDASDPGTVYVCSAYGVCSTSGSSRNGRPGRGQVEPQLVTSISGTGPWTIGISPGIRMPNISAAKSPQAWWDNGLPIQNDGIENLTIDDTPDASCCTNGIFILNGRNNWIRNIRSVYAAQKHVWLYQTTHTTIRDSYFYGSVPTSDHYATDSFVGADNLTENNIFQHVAASMMNEGCIGCVGAYNYALDDYYTGTPVGTAPEWQQASSYQHSVGDAYILWEGNQGIGMTSDDVHGTSNFSTAFRNYWNGRDIAGGSDGGKTLQTNAVILNTFNRFYNIVGNVLGTAGYHDNYTSAAPGGTSCNTSIYALGWGDNCSSGAIADDTLVATTLMRWGNYDTVNNAIRFDNSEVPTALAEFANPVPATQALPGSLYLDARPSWFGSVPWPPIGPDVTGGDSPNVGGHAYKIPAQLCYENSARDANGMLTNFNADLCYAAASGPAARPPANGK